jgi:hypothetical protein
MGRQSFILVLMLHLPILLAIWFLRSSWYLILLSSWTSWVHIARRRKD